MRSKKLVTTTIIVVILIPIVLLTYYRPHMTETYEDVDGMVYQCNKQVWVRYQAPKDNSRAGETPIDPSSTITNCRLVGIE